MRSPRGRAVGPVFGGWSFSAEFDLAAGTEPRHVFPDGYQAYWLRCRRRAAARTTVWLDYR